LGFGQRRVNVVAELEANYLARQNFRARTELNKLNLPPRIVQNFRECVVHEIELHLIEPKGYGEFQFFGRAGCDQISMKLAIVIQITWVAINRLLKIADHAEVPEAGTCRAVAARRRVIAFGFKPFAGSVYRPRNFEQNKKLLWIGVLSFVENDTIVLPMRFATSGRRSSSAASAT